MCKYLYIRTIHSVYCLRGAGGIHLLYQPTLPSRVEVGKEDTEVMKMTCSRKSITVSHESGIAQMIRKPPNQQQKAASKTIIIPTPKGVRQAMQAAHKPKPMTYAEAQERIAKELHLPSVHPVVQTQPPVSQPVQQAPEPSPWGTRPAGSKGLPAERLAERLAAPGGRISFKEAAARLKKETGLNIFNGK